MVKLSKAFEGRDIIDINDFSKEELLFLLKIARKFDPDFLKRSKRSNYTIAQGEIAAHLFFEPSTRTEQSFRSAAQKIGMGVIGFNDLNVTSMHKGETFNDTIRIMESYANVLIIRHPEVGSAKRAADIAEIPVINAGDGPNQHPTQTLLDLYTIQKVFQRLEGLKVAFVGDPKHYRTMRSLAVALFKFAKNKIFGISPAGLEMDNQFKSESYNDLAINMKDLDKTLEQIKPDVVYAGRIPKEYMKKKVKEFSYLINKATMDILPKHSILMHPLPRVDEMDPEVDSNPKAIYFKQARNGMYIREALLALVLGRI
ncbi:aspartate carbamoyltransferase [Candidatus Daviesbacteria bacterium]|nr:aspartate carbamoyltransferase [Candidatus Daviesbacteria bacterium]